MLCSCTTMKREEKLNFEGKWESRLYSLRSEIIDFEVNVSRHFFLFRYTHLRINYFRTEGVVKMENIRWKHQERSINITYNFVSSINLTNNI